MKQLFYNITIILLLSGIVFAQENQFKIIMGNKSDVITTYTRQGSVYISLNDFAKSLYLKFSYNDKTLNYETVSGSNKLCFTANSPFVAFVTSANSRVIQLPTSTFLSKNALFIPLDYTLGLLNSFAGLKITKGQNSLIVETTKTKEKLITEDTTKNIVSGKNIFNLLFDVKANGTLIRLKTNKKIASYNASVKDGAIKFIFRKVNLDLEKINSIEPKGVVKEISAKNVLTDAELIFTLDETFLTYEVLDVPGSNDIMITLHNKIFSTTGDNKKDKWIFDVVVIDAGHGGKDAGAIGVNGVKEKDVNLGIALKLGKLIQERMPDVKVVYTRSNDTFIELYKRGKIANDNGGKLFISIHCNSTPEKPSNATGFEVYLLRPGRTKEAINIASVENSVIKYEENPKRYKELTDENFILVSMAHSSYMKYSEKFSEFLNTQFTNNLDIPSRGIRQAGFYVLVGASMPSVLIETGFLSNRSDAEYLKSSSGQQKYAESIFSSIKNFKDYYNKDLTKE